MRRNVLLCGSALILLAAVAFSQERGGPGFGSRAFGPGGFGPGGMPASNAMLLGMPGVAKVLAISDSQQKQVKELLGQIQDQTRQAFETVNFQELPDLQPEVRDQRLAELRKKQEEIGKQADERLNKLLDAKQLTRLSQLRLQRDGAAAFGRPEIAKQLDLSKDQQEKIRRLEEPRTGRRQVSFADRKGNRSRYEETGVVRGLPARHGRCARGRPAA